MNPALAIGLYVVVLCAAFVAWQAGLDRGEDRPRLRLRPVATAVAFVVVAVPSVLQLTVAGGLLQAWQRDPDATWAGQLWRVATALVVQDGGWAGAVFNLAALLWIGIPAEEAWGSRRWTVIALCAGLGAQLWGWVVQPFGAGNSVVIYGLAASLLVRGLAGPALQPRIAGMAGLLAAAILLVGGDIHGGAAAIGAVVAVVLLHRTGGYPALSPRGGGASDR
ncbi:MAG TPA: rhomboid family intramembrane serine protease [Arthrobacter sp.]|nr:rhomboid family intramembrane serine protease [Arthrobacter sp.]